MVFTFYNTNIFWKRLIFSPLKTVCPVSPPVNADTAPYAVAAAACRRSRVRPTNISTKFDLFKRTAARGKCNAFARESAIERASQNARENKQNVPYTIGLYAVSNTRVGRSVETAPPQRFTQPKGLEITF